MERSDFLKLGGGARAAGAAPVDFPGFTRRRWRTTPLPIVHM